MTDQIEMPEEFTAPRGAGPQLRYARERLGLSVGDIAARTKISQRHVVDLEAGNFAAFTSRTYAIGFARTVAKAVGLDAEAIATQVRGELNALQPATRTTASYEPSDPARVPSQPLVWFSIVALGLLLAGLFFAYRTLFSPAAELPSLIEPQETPQAAASPAPSATPATSGPVVFTAMDDRIWVRFYDATDAVLLDKELLRGESFTVPAAANGPMVRTARPEALAITVGGRPVPPLATEMMTLRDVKVDAASLLARPAPQPSASASASPSATPSPVATSANVIAPVRTVPLSQRQPQRVAAAATPRAPRPAATRSSAPSGTQDAAAANAASAAAAADAAVPEAAPPPAAEPAPPAE